jgi:hypothetical protein
MHLNKDKRFRWALTLKSIRRYIKSKDSDTNITTQLLDDMIVQLEGYDGCDEIKLKR